MNLKHIEPAYVTFEQGKLLYDKGFNIPCQYVINKIERESSLDFTGEQTFSLEEVEEAASNSGEEHYLCPEQWKVLEWLRVNHNIDLHAEWDSTDNGVRLYVYVINGKVSKKCYNSPQEAYSAAFDYILKKLK
jgi:hypothetical protein